MLISLLTFFFNNIVFSWTFSSYRNIKIPLYLLIDEIKTSFPALSVYPRVGISLSASETDDRFYLSTLLPRTHSIPSRYAALKQRVCQKISKQFQRKLSVWSASIEINSNHFASHNHIKLILM